MKRMKELTEETIKKVKTLKQNPIGSLGFLIPEAMILLTVICSIYAYIAFIAQGGYSSQISLFQQNGFNGISKGFTSGTSGILVNSPVSTLILLLFFVQIAVMTIAYLKNAGKTKKNIMLAAFALLGIAGIVFLIAMFLNLAIPTQLSVSFINWEIRYGRTVGAICLAMVTIGVLIYAVLIFKSKFRWMLKSGSLSMAINYICAPLIILLAENIIPIVSGVITLIVIAAALCFGCTAVFSSFGSPRESLEMHGNSADLHKKDGSTETYYKDGSSNKYYHD
jgi:hypothetical protein